MKSISELKQEVIAAVDSRRSGILTLGEKLLRTPELGYQEYKTAAIVTAELEKLGLTPRTGLAVTGVRADIDSGKPGPRIAIVGELDALPVPTHPFADSETGAALRLSHIPHQSSSPYPKRISHLSLRLIG